VRTETPTAEPPIIAVGYSKGGLVLNQVLTEIASLPHDETRPDLDGVALLLKRIRIVHDLDVGAPRAGAYLVDQSVFDALAQRTLPPCVCLHGTPRQWRDSDQAWLEAERVEFMGGLQASGVPCVERLYLDTEPVGFAMHFGVVHELTWSLALTTLRPAKWPRMPNAGGVDGDRGDAMRSVVRTSSARTSVAGLATLLHRHAAN
jgi:hypothetical protein